MNRVLTKLNRIEEQSLGGALLGLAILTFVETALRYTVSYTFTWFQEFSNYMIVLTTFLGAAIGAKYAMHFSMEALTQYAPDRVSHLLKTVAYLISGAVVLLFIYFGTVHVFGLRSYGVKSAAMQIPMFIPYISIPFFSIPMAVRFFVHAWKHWMSFVRHEPFPKVRREES